MFKKTKKRKGVDLEDLERILPYMSGTYSAILGWIYESKKLSENVEIALKPTFRKTFSVFKLDPFNLEGKVYLKKIFKMVEIAKIKIVIPHKKHMTFAPILTLKMSREEYKRHKELFEGIVEIFKKSTGGTSQINFGE